MRAVVLLLLCGAVLAGCNRSANRVEIGGTTFRGKVQSTRDDRREMVVTVRPAAANPRGAVEAARYHANRYCILQFGTSEKTWYVGPDTPLDQLRIEDNSLTLTGRCTAR